jgi:hypothetical protein
MRITNMEINIEKGTLTLTDEKGETAKYRRDAHSDTGNLTHIRYDPISGWQFLRPLLDADTFPQELFVNEPSPGQPPQGPFPVIAMWSSLVKYVRDEG